MQQDNSIKIDWPGVVNKIEQRTPGTVKTQIQPGGDYFWHDLGITRVGDYKPHKPVNISELGYNPESKRYNNTEKKLLDTLGEHPSMCSDSRYNSYNSSQISDVRPHGFMFVRQPIPTGHDFPNLAQTWGPAINPSQNWGFQ